MSENTQQIRTIRGRVISTKMDKTITVLVERKVKHPIYGKYMKRSSKLHAHDEQNSCEEGDIVSLTSCRPYAKTKSWKMVEILERKNK